MTKSDRLKNDDEEEQVRVNEVRESVRRILKLTPAQNYIYIDIVENKEFLLLEVSWKLERTLDFQALFLFETSFKVYEYVGRLPQPS